MVFHYSVPASLRTSLHDRVQLVKADHQFGDVLWRKHFSQINRLDLIWGISGGEFFF